MRALLISTYELGRQPYGLASPAAWLRRAGWDVVCADITRERLQRARIEEADLVGVHLPMHTATRLAGPVISKIREINPSARVCAYGLYAPLNEAWLRSLGVDAVFGGEFEEALTKYATREDDEAPAARGGSIPRVHYLVPDRRGLPPPAQYATLQLGDGRQKVVGSTEASRGCKHLCRHCPVVPIYDGQFRIVPPEVVMADIDAQVAAGAEHITFGDPDFFNGPTHAMRVADALHAAHPNVTYDVTIKVEHLLRHRDLLPRLAATGCAFVTSAVESVDDAVLRTLEKGHTRRDFAEAVSACRDANLNFVPTFVAFHPWLTLDGYCDLLDLIDELDLVDHVAPIQLAIRLLDPRRVTSARTGRCEGANRRVRRGDAGVPLEPRRSPRGRSAAGDCPARRRHDRGRSAHDVRRDRGHRVRTGRTPRTGPGAAPRAVRRAAAERAVVLLRGTKPGSSDARVNPEPRA